MSHEFKVGDRVRLREDSQHWGQSGGSVGIVLSDDGTHRLNLSVKWEAGGISCAYPYGVLWGGRYIDNVYAACDLQHTSIFYAETDKKGLVI